MNPVIAAKRAEYKHKEKQFRKSIIQHVARAATKNRKISAIEKKQPVGTQINEAAKYVSWETGDDANGDIETFIGGHNSRAERAHRAHVRQTAITARNEYIGLTSIAEADQVRTEAEHDIPSPGPNFYL
jgi:hypothetical protein